MPASVVKILVHGADIASGVIIHVGQFSEEAQESRNKERKYCRRIHSRKIRDVSLSSKNDFFLILLMAGTLCVYH